MATLKVTQVRRTIGIKPKQRGTLRALGLRRHRHDRRACPTARRSAACSPGAAPRPVEEGETA